MMKSGTYGELFVFKKKKIHSEKCDISSSIVLCFYM